MIHQRPPPICFNCNLPGHIARDCKVPCKSYYPYSSEQSKNTIYANSAEMMQHEEYDGFCDYNYYDNDPWYLDSGATGHIAADHHKLEHSQSRPGIEIIEVKTGGGESHAVCGTGSATVNTEDGSIKLKSVKYVPSMRKNLVSVGAIADSSHKVSFSKSHCWITNTQGYVIASGRRDHSNGLYYFRNQIAALTTYNSEITTLWHRRLGHISFPNLYYLSQTPNVIGLPKLGLEKRICHCCLSGRQHRERFPKASETRAEKSGLRVHTDIMGPMQQESLGGSRYTLVFTYDYSRKSWVYFLKHKSETMSKFREFKKRLELETGQQLRFLCSNRGGEYTSNEFKTFCSENGIHQELTQAGTPQQNGVLERRNRTIMEKARSMAADCNLPKNLWTEVVSHATFLINRSPTRANSGMTPEEKYSGKVPDISTLRIFGCLAYVHVPKDARKKLDSKTRTCKFIGIDSNSKAFRLFDNQIGKIVISRDVIFDESQVNFEPSSLGGTTNQIQHFHLHFQNTVPTNPVSDISQNPESPTEREIDSVELADCEDTSNSSPILDLDHETLKCNERSSQDSPARAGDTQNEAEAIVAAPRRNPYRSRNPPTKLMDFWMLISEITEEPLDFNTAILRKGWRDVISSKVNSIIKNNTWDIIDRPTNRTPITAKWLFKVKKDAQGKINKLKARLVAKGFQQQEGIDYNDIFAPVVKWSTILTVFALAAKYGWSLHQLDVITAFLNDTIDEEILMEIPPGFPHSDDESKVCRINRALYGLKQSPRAWYDRITSWMQQQGLIQSSSDPNLYFRREGDKIIILLLYVDDLIITGNDQAAISQLKQEYEMTDLGEASSYLGIEIHRKPKGIFINQTGYINKLLQKFNVIECNPTSLPIDPKTYLKRNTGTRRVDPAAYRSIVGNLLYLAHTRPDKTYAVSCISRYMQEPEETHLQAAKKILRYLKGTASHGLLFSKTNSGTLHSYSDSDWGMDLDTRRSTSGILHRIRTTSIAWSSKLQSTISLSSTEAEYKALTEASKDIIHYRRLLQELGYVDKNPTTLLSDNQSSIKLVKNPIMHVRTKHIEIQHHFIRETANADILQVEFTLTETQLADFLTKPLPYKNFVRNRELAGVVSYSDP